MRTLKIGEPAKMDCWIITFIFFLLLNLDFDRRKKNSLILDVFKFLIINDSSKSYALTLEIDTFMLIT